MFTTKELRGKNSMLGRVQRQEDYAYSEKLKAFNSLNTDSGFKDIGKRIVEPSMGMATMKEPKRNITHEELGNKRRMLR